MTILERIAHAENSSDLTPLARECDVDVLGAIGMAAYLNPRYLALFRLKFHQHKGSVEVATEQFVLWTRRALQRRGDRRKEVRGVATAAMAVWVVDTCPACKGRRYLVLEGSPCLSTKPCPMCRGTGACRVHVRDEVVKDVLELADSAVRIIAKVVGEKFY